MAEDESGSVTESSDEEEEQLFVPRKKVSKVQETIYDEDCREYVDDIVSGEDLGGDEFPVCFIFRVDSRLAADELVTAIKDGSFDQKLAVVIRHFVDEMSMESIVRVLRFSHVSIRVIKRDYLHILMPLVSRRVN